MSSLYANLGGDDPGIGDRKKLKSSTHFLIGATPLYVKIATAASATLPKIPAELDWPKASEVSIYAFSFHTITVWRRSSGCMGMLRYAASTSNVAASVPVGASRITFETSTKVPHSHVKSFAFMLELTDGCSGSLCGNEKSCMIQKSVVPCLGTAPRGDDRKGPISDCSSVRLNGPMYRPLLISSSM